MAQKVWTAKEVDKILQIAQDIVWLDDPVTTEEDGETSIGQFIESLEPSPEDVVIDDDRRAKLLDLLDQCLKPHEIEILKLRFGFYNNTPETLSTVGEKYGVTRERIRQIEARALRKLRLKLAQKNVRLEDI